RGGLLFTTEIEAQAVRPIGDVRLVLAPGWFQGMTYNGIVPQPGSQSSREGSAVLTYGGLRSGQRLSVWISWQVDPTTLGRKAQGLSLFDGEAHLLTMPRTITVFP